VADLTTEFSVMQYKGVGKFCSKQFGLKKWFSRVNLMLHKRYIYPKQT